MANFSLNKLIKGSEIDWSNKFIKRVKINFKIVYNVIVIKDRINKDTLYFIVIKC